MDDIESNKLYSNLQMNTGIDFKALKDKYSSPIVAESDSNHSTISSEVFIRAEDENKLAFDKLGKYKVCTSCNGQGFVKIIYNHIVKQVNCDACEGDAILLLEQAVNAQSSDGCR